MWNKTKMPKPKKNSRIERTMNHNKETTFLCREQKTKKAQNIIANLQKNA